MKIGNLKLELIMGKEQRLVFDKLGENKTSKEKKIGGTSVEGNEGEEETGENGADTEGEKKQVDRSNVVDTQKQTKEQGQIDSQKADERLQKDLQKSTETIASTETSTSDAKSVFKEVKSLWNNPEVKAAWKEDGIWGIITYFFNLMFSGGSSEFSADNVIEEKQDEFLKKLQAMVPEFIKNKKLPAGIKLDKTEAGLLIGKRIDTAEKFNNTMKAIPTVKELVAKYPAEKAKIEGEKSLYRYLNLYEELKKKTPEVAVPEQPIGGVNESNPDIVDSTQIPPMDQAVVDTSKPPSATEVKPDNSPFKESLTEPIDFTMGAVREFELKENGHERIQIQRDRINIGGIDYKLETDKKIFGGFWTTTLRVLTNKITPKTDGSFDIIFGAEGNQQTETRSLNSDQMIALITKLGQNKGKDSFDHSLPDGKFVFTKIA